MRSSKVRVTANDRHAKFRGRALSSYDPNGVRSPVRPDIYPSEIVA